MDRSGAGTKGGAEVAELVWRELRAPDDLREGFELRHRTYEGCAGLGRFLRGGSPGSDFEVWDLHSAHYGLYLQNATGGRLVGGARFHGEEVRVRGEEIRLAVGDALAASPEYDSEPCALIRQFPEQAEPLRRLLRELRNQGEPFVEAGRLALLADVSAFNIDGRPLGHVLLELVVATGLFALPASHALFGCRRSHLAFYRRYGFDVVEGTVVAWDASLRDDYAIIHGRRDAVPAARRSRLEALASELMRAGEIHLSLYGYLSSDAGPS